MEKIGYDAEVRKLEPASEFRVWKAGRVRRLRLEGVRRGLEAVAAPELPARGVPTALRHPGLKRPLWGIRLGRLPWVRPGALRGARGAGPGSGAGTHRLAGTRVGLGMGGVLSAGACLSGVPVSSAGAGRISPRVGDRVTGAIVAVALRLASVVVICASTGCSDGVPEHEVVHPTSHNHPPKSALPIVRDTLPEGLSPDRLAAWRDARETFESAETLFRLGVLAGEGPEQFGQVSDVALSHDDRLFVLDGHAQEVRVFGRNGEFVESFGGVGDGPEEMRGAYEIVVEPGGSVLVLGTGRQVKVFSPTPAGYRFREHRPLPISGGMACITGSGCLIVAGADTRSDRNVVLHELPRSASEPVRSFGVGYRDSSAFIRFMLANRGPVACTEYEGGEAVLHAFVPLSFVRLMGIEDGAVLWTARLMDHRQLMMTGDAVSLTQDSSTEWDIVVTLLPYRDHHALLQMERLKPITPEEARAMSGPPQGTIHTYLLDVPSGRGASVAAGVAQVMAVNSNRYAVVTVDPYPEIEIRIFGTIER